MGFGQALIIGLSLALITAALSICIPLALHRKRKPVERVWHVWNPTGRLTLVGEPWPDHDEDYEDCACQSCYSVEITLMQPLEVESLFLGRVDTPECHEMANLARRWVP